MTVGQLKRMLDDYGDHLTVKVALAMRNLPVSGVDTEETEPGAGGETIVVILTGGAS